MRIAQVCPFYKPIIGGVENHVYNISRELIKKGHEIEIITTKHGSKKNEEKIDGIKIKRCKILFSIGKFAKFWPGVFLKILKNKYDIVHTHCYRHPHTDLSLIASKIKENKVFLTTHNPFHIKGVRSLKEELMSSFYDNTSAYIFLRNFNKVMCTSKTEFPFMLKHGVKNKNLVYLPNGIEKKFFKKYNGKKFKKRYNIKEKIALCVGRIHKTKGLQFLINNIPKIIKKERIKFVFVGPDDGYKNELDKLAKKLNVKDHILFTGRISENEKLSAYSACDIFVLPSIYEPFGIVILEAMAQGKPVIATKFGGPSEIIQDNTNGFLFNPYKEFSNDIINVLQDKKLYKKISLNAVKRAKEYLWEKIADKVDKNYKTVFK